MLVMVSIQNTATRLHFTTHYLQLYSQVQVLQDQLQVILLYLGRYLDIIYVQITQYVVYVCKYSVTGSALLDPKKQGSTI